MKKAAIEGDDKRRASSPQAPQSPKSASFGKDSGFTNLKMAMAVEELQQYHAYHQSVLEKELYSIRNAHNRMPFDAVRANLGVSLRLPVKGGTSIQPCNSIFATAKRFPQGAHNVLGPGEYGVNDTHPEWFTRQPALTLKPAGVGITLTLKENHATYQQSNQFSNPVERGQSDIVIKVVLKGGAVEAANATARSKLSVADVLLKIDGEPVTSLFDARRKLMGPPGTSVTIFYKHKDQSGGSTKMAHLFVRRYIGKNADRIGDDAKTEIYPPPGKYTGLGLQAERWEDRNTNMLTLQQEQCVLDVIHRLQEDMTPDNDNLLANRPCMIPAGPGIKRVTEEVIKEFPEWADEVSRPNAIVRVFKKHQFIQATYSDVRDNPDVAPGCYTPHRPAAHNLTQRAHIVQSFVTNPATADQEETKVAPTLADIQVEAEEMVVGRRLDPGEYHRLPVWKQRKLQEIQGFMELRDESGPGPFHYVRSHPEAVGQHRMAHKESGVGHHLKGVTIASKARETKGAGNHETPGPHHYNVRRDGLEASGDFLSRKGGVVVYREQIGSQLEQHPKEIPPEFYEKAGSISSMGHEWRKTPFTNAPCVTIGTREGWEKAARLEHKQDFDRASKMWIETVPGPGAYHTPRPPDTPKVPALHGREALEKEHLRQLGLVYDTVTKDYINETPGPAAYLPMVSKDGRSMQVGKGVRASSLGTRLNSPKAAFVTPGPGFYNVASSFDDGPNKSGFIGERQAPLSDKLDAPGPGAYDIRDYDGIGTDLVAIGASARAAHGMSATHAIHTNYQDTQINSVLNYSAINKVLEELKATLGRLFATVYDAFAYFDVDGDWGISESEFRRMLHNLDIHMDASRVSLIVRRMDTQADGTIDPKEFIQTLRWHPAMHKKASAHEDAMRRSCATRPIILKDVMKKVAQSRVAKFIQSQRKSSDTIARPKMSREREVELVRTCSLNVLACCSAPLLVHHTHTSYCYM